jgi:aromatic-L-amino-acid/L-tryptophan decarboxylase
MHGRTVERRIDADPGPASRDVERASLDRLSESIEALLPALERFTRFEGPDLAAPRAAWLPLIDEPLPEEGAGREAVLELLRDVVVARGLRIGHPGFLGWVTTAPSTVGVAAGLAQAVASPQRWWLQPGNHIDSMAVDWLRDLLGFPPSFVGSFTAGGSSANLVAMGAARQHAGERLGIEPARDGVAAMPGPRVYVTSETHHVVGRALGVLGLGRRHLREIPLDRERRMDVRSLEAALDEDIAAGRTPIAVVGNGGDVNTGIVDRLGPMADVAHERGVWFHVDGAYGGFGLLDERVRDRYGDVAAYDSFVVDPHKWLAAPVGTGLVLCRDGDLLGRAFTIEAGAYDRERVGREAAAEGAPDPVSPWESTGRGTPDWGLDFSTPSRGIAVWALLKEMGARGVRERIVRHDDAARRVAELVRASDELELLAEPELSICCFRYRPPAGAGHRDDALGEDRLDALNEAILGELRRRGRSLPSSTRVDGRFSLRACFINPRSTLAEADVLVEETLAAGRALRV